MSARNMKTPLLITILVTVLSVSGCSLQTSQAYLPSSTSPSSASAVTTAVSKQSLLFVSNQDGDSEIYAVNRDGSDLHQLTQNNREDYQASWSPDGQRVAFLSFRDGNGEIYMMKADGSEQQRLTNHPGLDSDPQWSPDGQHIAFTSNRKDDRTQLYVINIDGSGDLRQLTAGAGGVSAPRWSPDGSEIALRAPNGENPGNSDIALVSFDGSGYRHLTSHAKYNDLMFEWSPDGTQLAFVSRRNKALNIYTLHVATELERQLTDTPWIDAHPRWSPDGSRLLFLSTRDNQARNQVFVMKADGSEQSNLTQTDSEEMHPAWSADGSHIAFSSFRGGRYANIFVMKADGSSSIAMAPVAGFQSLPLFRPTQNHIQ